MKALSLFFAALMCFTSVAQAHDDENRTIADYEKALVQFDTWSKNINKPLFYKTTVMVDKNTKKQTKFDDLNDLQKDLFYLWQCEVLANQMLTLDFYWKQELQTAPARTKVYSAEELKDQTRKPDKDDIKGFQERLSKLRQTHAVQFEKLLDDIFKKQADAIPENDRKLYKARIVKWNDNQKLIERGE